MSNSAWTISLGLAEVAREIEFRRQGETTFKNTGYTTYVDQRTGSPNPKPFFQLPIQATAATFEVRYKDIRGNWQGPFELAFDPKLERIRWGKRILEQFAQQLDHHSSIQRQDGRLLLASD